MGEAIQIGLYPFTATKDLIMSTKIGEVIFPKTKAIKEQEQFISDKISGGRKKLAKEETEFLFARGREQRERRKEKCSTNYHNSE